MVNEQKLKEYRAEEKRENKKHIIELTLTEVIRLQNLLNNTPYWSDWLNIVNQLDAILKEFYPTKEA